MLVTIWLLGIGPVTGCFRFSSDEPPEAGAYDAAVDVSGEGTIEAQPDSNVEADASADESDGADASSDAPAEALPPPICQRFDPSIAQSIAGNLVTALLQDCKIQSAFTRLPPVALQHFEECFAAMVASVLGCVHPDGTRYKYPAYDSQGQFCRDMKTAHASLTTSDGDFDAFLADIKLALAQGGLTDDEVTRALRSFGGSVTRADIVKLKDAGPTQPCDAGAEPGPEVGAEPTPEAAPEAGRDAGSDSSLDGAPEASSPEGGRDGSAG
jgi:hypothetical protein